ncbi:MAG: OmpA family protein [Endomicrobium sp.]|jgi:peptidoglycan-associated lipoprotein|nr:OmpA family protein [Endomicrobium sp.]
MFVFALGCCKKQDIKHNSFDNNIKDDGLKTVAFTDEPSIRHESIKDMNLKTIYFSFDRSDLTNDSIGILKENSVYLTKNPKLKIVLEGHTDNRGTTEYNLALGQRRALKVKACYVQFGILANRIAAISYGHEKPADQNNNEVAWSKNRRVETKTLLR